MSAPGRGVPPCAGIVPPEPVSLPVDRRDHLLLEGVAIVGGPQGVDVQAQHLLAGKAGDAAEGGIDLEDDAP
jgi:hypothetical protein